MQTRADIPHAIQYNSVTNTFDALVTLFTSEGEYRYPCAVEGAITMPPAAAAFKLTRQAKQRHASQHGLRAEIMPMPVSMTPEVLSQAA